MSSSASAQPSSYTTLASDSMHRSYSGSYQQHSSDRSSRDSSMSTDAGTHRPEHNYDFNAPIHNGYQPQVTGYDDMVFPERKMY
jgi:hypothetical protein